MDDTRAQVGAQSFFLDNVDVAAEELLEILLERHEIEEISSGLEVDEEVDIT